MATMARALDRFQAITLRASFLQRCYLPEFEGTTGCDNSMMQLHFSKLRHNINTAREYHQSLYLGASGLQPFTDNRLLVSTSMRRMYTANLANPVFAGSISGTSCLDGKQSGSRLII
jgi:hypothetical protein